jgi:hypothetical protein
MRPGNRDRRWFAVAIAVATLAAPQGLRGQDRPRRDASGQLPDVPKTNTTGFTTILRRRNPKAPKPVLAPAPAPASVAVRIGGKVFDLMGDPVPDATVSLIGTQILHEPRLQIKSAIVATTKTRADGFYSFHDATIATSRFKNEEGADTPYVEFRVMARAEGFGVGWHAAESMYAVDPPYPDDIQGRHPLDSLVVDDIWMRPEADLKGRLVDEFGKAVVGVNVRLHDINLLNEEGVETTVSFNFDPKDLPDGFGRAVSDGDGRFRLAGLPAESCCWLSFEPQGSNATRWLYASTSAREKRTVPPPPRQPGRGKEVYPSDMVVTLPTTRTLVVRIVAADDGKPITNVYLGVMGETLATGIAAGGEADADGRVRLKLPAGTYNGMYADPRSTDMRFIRTSLRPLVVAEAPAEQTLEFKMTVGAEVRIEVVNTETGKGVPKLQFEIKPEGEDRWQPLRNSTFYMGNERTDEAGKFRALLAPVPGKSFRVRVLGSTLPADGLLYDVVEKESPPFPLDPARPATIRFTLRPRKDAK